MAVRNQAAVCGPSASLTALTMVRRHFVQWQIVFHSLDAVTNLFRMCILDTPRSDSSTLRDGMKRLQNRTLGGDSDDRSKWLCLGMTITEASPGTLPHVFMKRAGGRLGRDRLEGTRTFRSCARIAPRSGAELNVTDHSP